MLRGIPSIEEFIGSHFNDNLTGNSSVNRFWGGEGDDVINGGLGNDRLTGGDGNDSFMFNTVLNASTNVDTITDFDVADDRIQIDNAVFLGLPSGTLAASAFRPAPRATPPCHRPDYVIRYRQAF
jgi:Ca2+-binding RTX toxin-like protein